MENLWVWIIAIIVCMFLVGIAIVLWEETR